MGEWRDPAVVLYTDAMGSGSLGYALFDESCRPSAWSMMKAPPSIKSGLCKRKTQLTAWETFAPLWAIMQETDRLRGRRVHLYVDNRGAECAIRKGASRVEDINAFVLGIWLQCFDLTLELTVFRVPSKENPADAPSRGVPPVGASDAPAEIALDFFWKGEVLDTAV